MIVGKGLIAKAFEKYCDRADVVIFASGVSNSLEENPNAFLREQNLLIELLQNYSTCLFVYFGTCSVYDPSMMSTSYVQHKLRMEKLVSERSPNFLIFRLPQVVGKSGNKATIINYLSDNIVRGNCFELWADAVRYIVDIDDVVRFVVFVLDELKLRNQTVNMVAVPYKVQNIVSCLEKMIGRKADYKLSNKGAYYAIPSSAPSLTMTEAGIVFDDDYLEKVLMKYSSV